MDSSETESQPNIESTVPTREDVQISKAIIKHLISTGIRVLAIGMDYG